MQDEFVVISVTREGGSWPVTLCEFPGCLNFQVGESWVHIVNEFQLEALYPSDKATAIFQKGLGES